MKNKEETKKRIIIFRDKLKDYRDIWLKIVREQYSPKDEETLFDKEEKLREKLTEDWGRLKKIFFRLNVPTITVTPFIGYKEHIFEEALSGKLYNNSLKSASLINAISSATQAIGAVDSLTDLEFKRLTKKTPILFLSYSFKEKKEKLVSQIKQFLEGYPISVTTGAKPSTDSISEKVKQLIGDSDYVLAILTKDEEQKDKSWTPSKWVCDELVFAMGKGKTVIRLLEEGVNYKPAISGDAEYISFKRDNLTEALIKLAHILNTFLK